MAEVKFAPILYRKSIPQNNAIPEYEFVKGSSLTNDEIDANFRSLVLSDADKATIKDPQFQGGITLPQYTEDEETGNIVPVEGNVEPAELHDGMLRWNKTTQCVEYYLEESHSWYPLASIATGGRSDKFVYLNDQHITNDYEIPTGKNGMTAGPVTVDEGVTVTVANNAVWTIV